MCKPWESTFPFPVCGKWSAVAVVEQSFSLDHHLEQAVPGLIGSEFSVKSFRRHALIIHIIRPQPFIRRIAGLIVVFFSFFFFFYHFVIWRHSVPKAGGLMGTGLWNPLQCFLCHWAICFGPSGVDNNTLRMKYSPWRAFQRAVDQSAAVKWLDKNPPRLKRKTIQRF